MDASAKGGLSVVDPVGLAAFTDIRREAVRPAEFRGPDFVARYDGETFLFDAFRAPFDDRIILLGPPFLNLRPHLAGMRIVAVPSGRACRFRLRDLDRHAQIWIDAPPSTRALELRSGLGAVTVQVGPNLSEMFGNRRVMLTLSKDNRLEWIMDWVRYHRDRHGADAVLIYDNASSTYAPEHLVRALRSLAGLKTVQVVPWPFKYGPQGLDARRFWDSDYCQHGVLEHARWRHLAKAASVMNGDVDEFVIGRDEASVFAAAERSLAGIVRYNGRWTVGIEGDVAVPSEESPLRHRDFGAVLRERRVRRKLVFSVDANGCPPKWTLVPRRCPSWSQWRVHRVSGWPASRLTTRAFSFRHFRQINTGWKYDRVGFDAFDPGLHTRDVALIESCAKVNWGL